jgi:hypothetical protein
VEEMKYVGGQHKCERRYMDMWQMWKRYVVHAEQMGEIRHGPMMLKGKIIQVDMKHL